jgi:23S rRNA (adenine2503-C2)-methyltransferase
LTCAQYVQACKGAGVPAGDVAVGRYARFFRAGDANQPGLGAELPRIVRTHTSESGEGTVLKFTQAIGTRAIANPDGTTREQTLETESVLIPMIGKKRTRSYTLCVSSQVGCAMGCAFCQTAQMGLIRSLSAEQIVAQWFAARHLVARPDPEAPIRNIVFMGMGEPMDNLDAVLQAIEVLSDNRGPEIAKSRITISTVGRIDGLQKLAARVREPGWHRLGLAISLNAPSDEVRSKIMPINRGMPMGALRHELVNWPFFSGVHLCLEYVLIPGVNDSMEHVQELAQFVLGNEYRGADGRAQGSAGEQAQPSPFPSVWEGPALRGLINVIPYNPRDNSPWPAPSEESVDAFIAALSATGVYVKRRRTKGRDTMAACGQLGNPEITRKQARVSLTVSGG